MTKISLISDKNIDLFLGINEGNDYEYYKKIKKIKKYIIIDIDKGKIFYSKRNDILKKLTRKICKDGSIFKKEEIFYIMQLKDFITIKEKILFILI